MNRLKTVRSLIHQHYKQLLLTYTLFSIEMMGTLLRPFFLGMAINDLMVQSYRGLIIFTATHIIWAIVGTVRHMYDTRTYSTIYVSLVTKFLSRRNNNTDVSKLSAHSTLAREYVDFLEYDLVYVIEAIYNLGGSLILLLFYQSSVVGICLAVIIPVIFISKAYGKRMQILTKKNNDELEKQVAIITSADENTLKNHYNNLRHWQIKKSDQEAYNFGIMEIIVMIVMGFSLLLTYKTTGKEILAGNVVGIFFYVSNFAKGLETIPYTIQRLTSLSDITKRIDEED